MRELINKYLVNPFKITYMFWKNEHELIEVKNKLLITLFLLIPFIALILTVSGVIYFEL